MDAGDDWRAQLQPAGRGRIVNKILQTLMKVLPISLPEGLVELQRIAVRFEDRVYAAATSQTDYLRKISLKMLSMESQASTQLNPAPGSSSKGKKQKKLRCHFCKKVAILRRIARRGKYGLKKKELLMIQPMNGLKQMAIKMKALYLRNRGLQSNPCMY